MIFILIPVYNEASNLGNLHRELSQHQFNDGVHFVFSDDGSTDDSKKIISSLFEGARCTVLGDGINRGPGAVFNTGFEWILHHAAPDDTVITIEADCTSDLDILPTMLALHRMGYDLVLASVYAQGGGFEKTSFLRKLISATANFIFRFLFDIQVLTLSSFYRVYSISLLRKMQSKFGTLIHETGFVCMLEILIKAIHCHAKVIEVPMKLHSSKRAGKSKMKIVKTTLQYFRFLIREKMK